jgi:mono/diheme cytochrome c family protein
MRTQRQDQHDRAPRHPPRCPGPSAVLPVSTPAALVRFLGLPLIGLAIGAAGADLPAPVRSFVAAHCTDCHDADSARAGFRIDLLTADFTAGNTAGQWKEVMDKINGGEMPPKKKPRPNAQEAATVANWVAAQLDATTKAAQGAGGRVPMRRLNRVEYANTVRDLFALEDGFARRVEKELPADGKVGGFDRGAAGLFMDEGQLTQYLAVADLVLDEAVFNAKPETVSFTYDATKEKYVHGIGVAFTDASGKIIDDNPTPSAVAALAEPLSKIAVDNLDQWDAKSKRYVPHGPFDWKLTAGGIEYLSGGNNYRNPGNMRSPFFTEEWGKKGVKRDGWYRMRIQAGAFAGEGKEAQKDVRLVVEYCYGTPIEVVRSAVIDAPLTAPKQYEFLMYLQAGPPGMNRTLHVGWDNGNKDVVIRNPLFQDVQWKPVTIAGQIEDAIKKKKSADDIAVLRKQSEAALALALESRKTFAGPYLVYDPKLDIAKRPRLWVGAISWEGPIVEWPPKGRTTLLFAGEERDDQGYVHDIFARLLPLAYRRPASSDEIERVVAWTMKAKAERKLSLVQAVREGVKNVLCSPAFLYLGSESALAGESARRPAGPQPIDGWQLASRLSYLLWSSTPDAELYQLAQSGQLREPAVLQAQIKRMIADAKAGEFIRSFAGQWLSVRNFDNGTPPNRDFYRTYDDALRDSSKREPLEFFSEVLRKNLPLTCFLDSDFLIINERLAKHYGIDGVEGEEFRRVAAPADGRRGGVLGMAGLMTYLADGTRTLPVRRATWVLDMLWNQPVPPPPPNAGDLPVIKDKKLTVRERLGQHRLSDNCASCHSRVDPFGLALENYDAIGMWRDRQNGEGMHGDAGSPPLDVSGSLPTGHAFTTIQEFKAALIADKAIFIKGFTEKFLCYALGRPIGYGDHLVVEQIIAEAAKHENRLQDLIQATVASTFFQTQ